MTFTEDSSYKGLTGIYKSYKELKTGNYDYIANLLSTLYQCFLPLGLTG